MFSVVAMVSLCTWLHNNYNYEIIDVFKSHGNINFTTQGSAIKAKTTINLLSIIHISIVCTKLTYIEYQVHENYVSSS